LIVREAPFELSHLNSKHTGLPFVVWISVKAGAKQEIRVKVSPGPKTLPDQMASVAIRPDVHLVGRKMSASDLALLAKWIELNRDVLLKYWEGDIDTRDALDALRSL
jgi:hypothetical protein